MGKSTCFGTCVVGVCFSTLFISQALGQLSWDQREIHITAKPADTSAAAVFSFRNRSDHNITITSIRTSCGCTTATLEKKTYAPGENGEIRAAFLFGDRVGAHRKTVVVETDDPGQRQITLALSVQIPELLQIRPRFVYWRNDEEPTKKKILIDRVGSQDIRIVRVESNDPAIQATISEVPEGHRYELWLVPVAKPHPTSAKITIFTQGPGNLEKQWTVNARVYAE